MRDFLKCTQKSPSEIQRLESQHDEFQISHLPPLLSRTRKSSNKANDYCSRNHWRLKRLRKKIAREYIFSLKIFLRGRESRLSDTICLSRLLNQLSCLGWCSLWVVDKQQHGIAFLLLFLPHFSLLTSSPCFCVSYIHCGRLVLLLLSFLLLTFRRMKNESKSSGRIGNVVVSTRLLSRITRGDMEFFYFKIHFESSFQWISNARVLKILLINGFIRSWSW